MVTENVAARRLGRVIGLVVPALLAGMVLAGCGPVGSDDDDLPPMPPTMTPSSPFVTPSPPTDVPADLEGEILEPLENGQEVAPMDGRYAIRMPDFWVSGIAPNADIAYREGGGTPVDHGYSFNVMREQVPAGVRTVQDYADSGRAAMEETFEDVETMSMEPVQVAGMQAVRWIFTTTVTSDTVLIHQIYVMDGSTGFILTGSAPADGDLTAAIDLFSRISGSFSFPRG